MNLHNQRHTPCIVSVGKALPGDPIDNATLSSRFGINESWIDLMVGTRTRHFSVDLDSGAIHSNLTELCALASAQAMERAGVDSRDIDFLVMSTASPDELMPATVNRVADLLGIDQVPTYQLQSGCAGAVQAFDLACLLLQQPQHRMGLVIGGDVCTKHLRLYQDFSKLPPSALVNYVLFGDGAGAVVMGSEPINGGFLLHSVLNQLTGRGQHPGQVIQWYGDADRDTPMQAVNEDYKAIERRVPVMAREVLLQLLDATGWQREDLAFFMPPQLSGRMTRMIADTLELPGAQEVSCVAETANSGNALPFMQIDRLSKLDLVGAKGVAIAIESSKWIKGGLALEAV